MANLSITLPSCSTPAIAAHTTAPATGPNYNAHPSYVMRNLSPIGVSQLFTRASQATLEIDGVYRLVGVNKIRFDVNTNAYLIEPVSTNYLTQQYTLTCSDVGHALTLVTTDYSVAIQDDTGRYIVVNPDVPETQSITLPLTGRYCLWVRGECEASISVSSGSAIMGSSPASDTYIEPAKADYAMADITQVGGYGHVSITVTEAPAVVLITISNAVAGDEAQLESTKWPTSYIPNTSTSGTTMAAEYLYAPEV